MNSEEIAATMSSSELKSTLATVREDGMEAIENGQMDKAAFFTGLYERLSTEHQLRRFGGLEQREV